MIAKLNDIITKKFFMNQKGIVQNEIVLLHPAYQEGKMNVTLICLRHFLKTPT